jgi:hypothetical protein
MNMIKPITKPNFFILGAAKSGTTVLYDTLKEHPEIFLSPEKEPSFFCNHLDKHINSTAKYFDLYEEVKDEPIIGEASHIYLTDPSSPCILKGLFPEAKFLVSLRNPADKAYSQYVHLRRDGFESYNTFEKALHAENKRLNSERFKKNNQYYYSYLYFHSGLFGQQLQRYFFLFDRAQFHIITLEQLKNYFEETIENILVFLKVDSDITLTQADKNKGYDVRFLPIQRLQRRLPRQYRKYLDPLAALNKTKTRPINKTTRAELMNRYKTDLSLLYELTNIYLTK